MFKEGQEVIYTVANYKLEATIVCEGVYFSCIYITKEDRKSIVSNSDLSSRQKAININGFEVTEPLREVPEDGTKVYLAGQYSYETTQWVYFVKDSLHMEYLRRGLLHLIEEAAILHTKALLSFTEKQDETK